MVAVTALTMVPAVAVKLAELAPAGTVTEAGTPRRAELLERPTVMPPLGAAALKAAVQVAAVPLVKEDRLQLSPVSDGAAGGAGADPVVVMLPPVPVTCIGPPMAVAPRALENAMGSVPADFVVTLMTATTPLGIAVSFRPATTQV